ncbi:MAG TPA: hypothetical protein VGG36_01740 [Rhizomicrobium sp.]|jgi:ABC-2 type transport system permease protein
MTAASDTAGAPAQSQSVANMAPTRPFYWSLRRELWEHRAIWIAPLVVAGLVLFGFLIRLPHFPQMLRKIDTMPLDAQQLVFGTTLAAGAAAITIAGVIVAVFYCLGCLSNERRDRSILFWKSLPVSDLTAVLAKVCVPFIVLPIVIFAVAIVTQLIILGAGSAVVIVSGLDASPLWTHWPFLKMAIFFVYVLVVMTLWYAPIYGWLMLVSSWAQRMTFLWAVLAPLGIAIVEAIAFQTWRFGSLIGYRLDGFEKLAFTLPQNKSQYAHLDPLQLLDPARFFSDIGLWVGIAFAVVFIAGAVWLRRGRELV